tara:strand:- start:208 stop:426 length:219 start_codon:yes stop_codon:yes gene_type:complete
MKIVWNYEDIESNLLAIEYDNNPIGYFRIDKADFVVIAEPNHNYPIISLDILNQIVSGYNDALSTAKKMIKE